MDRMGWSWSELQETPVGLVEHLVEQMQKEAKQQKAQMSRRRMR